MVQGVELRRANGIHPRRVWAYSRGIEEQPQRFHMVARVHFGLALSLEVEEVLLRRRDGKHAHL